MTMQHVSYLRKNLRGGVTPVDSSVCMEMAALWWIFAAWRQCL